MSFYVFAFSSFLYFCSTGAILHLVVFLIYFFLPIKKIIFSFGKWLTANLQDYYCRRFNLIHGSYYLPYYVFVESRIKEMGNTLDIIFINLIIFWEE